MYKLIIIETNVSGAANFKENQMGVPMQPRQKPFWHQVTGLHGDHPFRLSQATA